MLPGKAHSGGLPAWRSVAAEGARISPAPLGASNTALSGRREALSQFLSLFDRRELAQASTSPTPTLPPSAVSESDSPPKELALRSDEYRDQIAWVR